MTDWNPSYYEASRTGLKKLVADRPKVFLIHELVSNAWDTGCKTVDVTLEKVPRKPLAKLRVVDDHPEGFSNLSHAYTLFAESERKSDPETIGRFDLGEKLVLALCDEATIATTTGTVEFHKDKGRRRSRKKTKSGSVFEGLVEMTHEEFFEVIDAVPRILARPDVATTFNGTPLLTRDPIARFEATLPTVLGDDGGSLRRTKRKTIVEVYEPIGNEETSIYELGIPVVATGDRYHVNVRQKVPLNMDRDNVPPSFLKLVRALVLSNVVDHISKEEATETWVTEAMGHKDVAPEAVRKTVTKRFGEKAAIYDPSDREANHRLTGQGYTVVSGGTLPKEVWSNVKSAGALKPSGTIAPTSKPYSDNPNAKSVDVIPREKWTVGMEIIADLTETLARLLMDVEIEVRIVNTTNNFGAAYGSRCLDFNLMRLGHKWFNEAPAEKVLDLIIHEFGHEYADNHLSDEFHKALTRLAGKLAVAVNDDTHLLSPLYTAARSHGRR